MITKFCFCHINIEEIHYNLIFCENLQSFKLAIKFSLPSSVMPVQLKLIKNISPIHISYPEKYKVTSFKEPSFLKAVLIPRSSESKISKSKPRRKFLRQWAKEFLKGAYPETMRETFSTDVSASQTSPKFSNTAPFISLQLEESLEHDFLENAVYERMSLRSFNETSFPKVWTIAQSPEFVIWSHLFNKNL